MIRKLRRYTRLIIEKLLFLRGFSIISSDGTIDFQRNVLIKKFNIQRIIDVGVNEGQFSLLIRKYFKSIPITAFDPDPRIAEDIKALNLKNHTFHNIGLGDKNEIMSFNLWPIEGGSSSFKILSRDGEEWTYFKNSEIPSTNVEVKCLDSYDFLEDKIYLKIDVQGFEMEVLKGSLNLITDKIKVVEIEVPALEIYQDSSNLIQVHEYLTNNNFQLSSIHSSRFHKIGVADFDCIYYKV
jgi:FkbM family methyltransferase